MQQASKIFLIGFMGSGKSTMGKRLASYLKWSFVDLDEKIENRDGMSIPDIFSQKGESFFPRESIESSQGASIRIKYRYLNRGRYSMFRKQYGVHD